MRPRARITKKRPYKSQIQNLLLSDRVLYLFQLLSNNRIHFHINLFSVVRVEAVFLSNLALKLQI